jgi:hypothetical protein
VALFISIVVGVIVLQTWLDWRGQPHALPLPAWMGGLALGGILAPLLATGILLFEQKMAGEWAGPAESHLQWPQVLFVFAAMGILVFAIFKRHTRLVTVLAVLLLIGLCLSLALLA